jgi:hypothetical protein
VDDLSSTTAVVALAAAGVALAALIVAVVAVVRLRRLAAAQQVVLGEGGARDVVGHIAALDESFRVLHDYVEDVAARLDGRLGTAEARLDGALAYHGLVRYDAYNEMSGRQSLSIALLDTTRSGVVLTSIHHRDQARVYAKLIRDGRGELELSPEEQQALDVALANDVTLREPLVAEPDGESAVVVRRRTTTGRRSSRGDAGEDR